MRRWTICASVLLLAGCEALAPPSGPELPGSSSGSGTTAASGSSGTSSSGSGGSSGSSGCGGARCPEVVLTGLDAGSHFEVHQARIYWTRGLADGGEELAARDLDGGPVSELVFPGFFNTWRVAGGAVYWSNETEVWLTPLDGGTATEIAATSSLHDCQGIAVGDGGTVFYSREPSNGVTYDGWITAWNSGDAPDGGVVLDTGVGQVWSMVPSDDWLTWSDLNSGYIYSRSSADGGVVTLGREGQSNDGLYLAPAGTRVLWLLESGCQFGFATPGQPDSGTTVFNGPFNCNLEGARADSNSDVYFLTDDASNFDGGLFLEPAGDDGGNTELLVGGLTSPNEVWLDGSYVYFVNDSYAHPEVLRVAK